MPTTLYLQASGHPALKLCDPWVPCTVTYNPATMTWAIQQTPIFDDLDDDTETVIDAWLDDANAWQGEPPVEPPPPVFGGGYGNAGVYRQWTDEEDERLERALRDLETTVRQARTPRVRQIKLGQAVDAADRALSLAMRAPLPAIVATDLSDVRQMLASAMTDARAFVDMRLALMQMIQGIMLAAQVEAEEDEDAMWLLMVA